MRFITVCAKEVKYKRPTLLQLGQRGKVRRGAVREHVHLVVLGSDTHVGRAARHRCVHHRKQSAVLYDDGEFSQPGLRPALPAVFRSHDVLREAHQRRRAPVVPRLPSVVRAL